LAHQHHRGTNRRVQRPHRHPPAQSFAAPIAPIADPEAMFIVYALNIADNADTETECETLDEALIHLRELITSEMEADEGPAFDRYGIAVDGR
jgi:hypothetical protein